MYKYSYSRIIYEKGTTTYINVRIQKHKYSYNCMYT